MAFPVSHVACIHAFPFLILDTFNGSISSQSRPKKHKPTKVKEQMREWELLASRCGIQAISLVANVRFLVR